MASPTELFLHDGERWVRVGIEKRGKRLVFRFRFNRALQAELKAACSATRWNHFKEKEWSAENTARTWFALDVLSEGPQSVRMWGKVLEFKPKREVLYHHQQELFNFALTRRCGLAAYDMGLGKTLTFIEVMEYIRDNFVKEGLEIMLDKDRFWVICPKNLRNTWADQIDDWDSSLRPKIITNSYQGIQKAMEQAVLPPQCVVVDESSNFRRKSKRTDLAVELSNRVHKFWEHLAFTFCLSGRPSPKDYEDWWYQCEIAKPGFVREANLYKYRDRIGIYEKIEGRYGGTFSKRTAWCNGTCLDCGKPKDEHDGTAIDKMFELEDDGFDFAKTCTYIPRAKCTNCHQAHHQWYSCGSFVPDRKDVDEISQLGPRLAPLVLVRRKEDCADLPDKVYTVRRLTPTDDLIGMAEMVVEQCETKLQVLQKLRQMSDGFLYETVDDEEFRDEEMELKVKGVKKTVQMFDENPKLDAFAEYVNELVEFGENRLIGYAAYKASIDLLIYKLLELDWKVIALDSRGLRGYNLPDDAEPGDRWFRESHRDEENKVAFVGHPQSMGMGLNLQVSKHVFFYSNDFKAEYREQAIDRAHRLGMDDGKVTITDFALLGTDLLVLQNLNNKKDAEDLTLGEIKAVFQR